MLKKCPSFEKYQTNKEKHIKCSFFKSLMSESDFVLETIRFKYYKKCKILHTILYPKMFLLKFISNG